MITFLFHLTAKPGVELHLHALLQEMTSASRADAGCQQYQFLQLKSDARQWVLHEQWRDQAALDAHVAQMFLRFGAPPPGARLPARLHELSESFRVVPYEALT